MTNWPKPCEKEFVRMGEEDPEALIRWIAFGDMKPYAKTFAVAALGRTIPLPPPSGEHSALTYQRVLMLLSLLSDESALVREGALQGLYYFHLYPHLEAYVRPELVEFQNKETRPELLDLIKEILDDWDE